jgi:DNA mismatch repair protein MutL
MSNVIQLLPDSIANQIAAGEVVQRPASAVKELLENAVDAGSRNIQLIVKEAGKVLIQVIDDGCGMSETDARMSFERHATSKIREAKDLFALSTLGFRGEALASIASIAQVELKTRRAIDELGTQIIIEGFELKSQEPCQSPAGTNFQIKNLFYNVPARRNFLKSNTVELRHILDEFERVAIANPDIFFSLHHNNQETYHLPAGNLRQRLVGIFGKDSNKKFVPVSEETDALKIEGFVGKPEFAKKTRGEQFFFVNNRFIKSSYLNHAVTTAYEELIGSDSYPFYVLFMEIDPARIDVNIHPTKQEIKFEDERLIYNYLKVAVRHALGRNSVTPTLDFEQEQGFGQVYSVPRAAAPISIRNFDGFGQNDKEFENAKPSDLDGVKIDWSVPTQENQPSTSNNQSGNRSSNPSRPNNQIPANIRNWESLYAGLDAFDPTTNESEETISADGSSVITIKSKWEPEQTGLDDKQQTFSKVQREPYQVHAMYIVNHIKSGFLLIDQQAAHERILYEKYLYLLNEQKALTQKELFPKTLNFSPSDAAILREILPQINQLGFDINEFGGETFILHGIPAEWQTGKDEQKMIEGLIGQFKQELDLKLDVQERIAKSMARSAATKRGTLLTVPEMQNLVDKLFACSMPFKSPFGKNCFITFDLEELQKQF